MVQLFGNASNQPQGGEPVDKILEATVKSSGELTNSKRGFTAVVGGGPLGRTVTSTDVDVMTPPTGMPICSVSANIVNVVVLGSDNDAPNAKSVITRARS